MNRRFLVSETILRSATRCSLLSVPGPEALSTVHLAQVLALFLSLAQAQAQTWALVLAGEVGAILG